MLGVPAHGDWRQAFCGTLSFFFLVAHSPPLPSVYLRLYSLSLGPDWAEIAACSASAGTCNSHMTKRGDRAGSETVLKAALCLTLSPLTALPG